MTDHQIWATAVVVWFLGLFMAWCIGYAARDRHDPARHSGLIDQLARVRLERAAALDEFDQLEHLDRERWETHRLPQPVAVHVHIAPLLPWPPHQPPRPLDTPRLLDAIPVLPVKEVQSWTA